MKSTRRLFRRAVLPVWLLLFFCITAFRSDSFFEMSKNLEIFAELYKVVNENYVGEVKPGDMMTNGIDGMLDHLDPYTQYIPESDIENYRMTFVSPEYGGIGAQVHKRGDSLEIAEVYEGFPAQRAGLRAGDILFSINGKEVKGKSVEEVTSWMKGQANATITMKVQRRNENQLVELQMNRGQVKFPNVSYSGMLDDSTGYIRLDRFLENSANEVSAALAEVKKNGARRLIFDLRGNGGGRLQDAVDIVNLFVDKSVKIVSQRGRKKENTRDYYATAAPAAGDMKLTVLIDKNSASASEVVAGALQDLDRAVIVGQRSFGKGLVQQTFNLPYNSMVKITVAKYYTPSGRCIQKLDYQHRASDGTVSRVADSTITAYKTRNGRTVYDARGIAPDISVEPETYSQVALAMIPRYTYFDYATAYRASHDSIGSEAFRISDNDWKNFTASIDPKKITYTSPEEKIVADLRKKAQKTGSIKTLEPEIAALEKKIEAEKSDDITEHADEIKHLLESEIVSRYSWAKGRIRQELSSDKTLAEAIKVLNDSKKYNSVLKGEGEFLVIGKPEKDSQSGG